LRSFAPLREKILITPSAAAGAALLITHSLVTSSAKFFNYEL